MKSYTMVDVDRINLDVSDYKNGIVVFRVISKEDEISIFGVTDFKFLKEDDEDGNNTSIELVYFTKTQPSQSAITSILDDIMRAATEHAEKIIKEHDKGQEKQTVYLPT